MVVNSNCGKRTSVERLHPCYSATAVDQKIVTLVIDLDNTLMQTIDQEKICVEDIYGGAVYSFEFVVDRWSQSQGKWVERTVTRWAKVRPGAKAFLERFHKQGFQLVLYTNGIMSYAQGAVQCIDPCGKYFGKNHERLIARQVETASEVKSLTSEACQRLGLDPMMCIVIDDRLDVWEPKSRAQVLRVRPYIYFRNEKSSRTPPQMFPGHNIDATALEESDALQRFDDGEYCPLKLIAEAIERVTNAGSENQSIARALAEEQGKVLQGTVIAFSGIMPRSTVSHMHIVWQEAERYGARCVHTIDAETTHLVMHGDQLTPKFRQAEATQDQTNNRVKIVSLEWLTESTNCWAQLDESSFPAVLSTKRALARLNSKRHYSSCTEEFACSLDDATDCVPSPRKSLIDVTIDCDVDYCQFAQVKRSKTSFAF